jgi:hypothetical protein
LLPLPFPSLLLASLVSVAINHIVHVAITIALVAGTRLPPLLPVLLPLLTWSSLSHTTIVTIAITLLPLLSLSATTFIAITVALETIALFVASLIICCMLSLFANACRHGCVVINALLLGTASL